jgi:hypothetical protein
MGALAILKATTGPVTAMNATDTRQNILDAVDAGFDAQLASAVMRSTTGISMSTS